MKKKMKLQQLEVESFITAYDHESHQTIKGGTIVIGLKPRPRTFGCPSVDTVSCLPPKSEGCFSEAPGNCTETLQFL